MNIGETAFCILKSTRDLDSRNRKNVEQIIAQVEKLATNELKEQADVVLLMWVEYVLRTSSNYCALAAMQLVEWLNSRLVSPEAALEVLARWERAPVGEFDPNLGVGVYEHLLERRETAVAFRQWRKDPHLRKRYIQVGYCLDEDEALELYDWAIDLGETDAVRDSLLAIGSPRHVKDSKRWERILGVVGVPLSAIAPSPPPAPSVLPPSSP